jgi:hypothetical protein
MGVMRHLADFLRMLSVPCRVSYLPLLHEIIHSTNPFNWRLRQCLAVQVPDLLLLPPPELVFNTLYLLIITLLQDPVASVRKDSFTGVAKMMVVLSEHADTLSAFACLKNMNLCTRSSSNILNTCTETKNDTRSVEQSDRWNAQHLAATAAHHVDTVARAINCLIQSKTYQLRQLWVELSHALLQELPKSLFEKYFLDGLLYLTSDPVSNVRVAVGIVLTGWDPDQKPTLEKISSPSEIKVSTSDDTDRSRGQSPWDWLLRRTDVRACVQRLACDDKDVYISIVKLHSIFPDIEMQMQSCRGLKQAPGGAIPVPNAVTGAYSTESFLSMGDKEYANGSGTYTPSEPYESPRSSRKMNSEINHFSADGLTSETLPPAPLHLSSPIGSDKERGNGFGVKSPGRGSGVLATAIAGLMQQQEEEIEQERLMHLKNQGHSSSSEVTVADKGDISLGSLDALMRVEGEWPYMNPRTRGMIHAGEIYDDQLDEEEDEEDDPSEAEIVPPSPPSPVGVESAKYAEQNGSAVRRPSAPSSSSFTTLSTAEVHLSPNGASPAHSIVTSCGKLDPVISNTNIVLSKDENSEMRPKDPNT